MLRCVNPSLLVYIGLGSSMVEHPYMRWEVLGSNTCLATFSCFTGYEPCCALVAAFEEEGVSVPLVLAKSAVQLEGKC
jgi:hypothetical protein